MWDFEGVVTVRLLPHPPSLQSQLVVRAERHVNLRNFHIQQKVEGWVTIWDVYSRRALNIERGCLILKQLNRHFNKQKEGRMRLGRECRVKNRRNMENINCRRLSGSLHQLSAYLYLWNMQERVASKINIAAPSVEQSVHNFIRARHSSGNFGFFQCSFFRVFNSVASGEFIEWVF